MEEENHAWRRPKVRAGGVPTEAEQASLICPSLLPLPSDQQSGRRRDGPVGGASDGIVRPGQAQEERESERGATC